MRITIFGATGRTGKSVVEQALAAGHEVKAFARTPSKLTIRHERLTIEQGDALELEAVLHAIRGADAVISVMATAGSQKLAKRMPLTRATQNIIDAMKASGVRRLIISPGGIPQPGDARDVRYTLLMSLVRFVARASYDDTVGSVNAVRASNVDWTVVRMPSPTNGRRTERVRSGSVSKTMGMRISRQDAAAFMLNEVTERRYVREAPVICSG